MRVLMIAPEPFFQPRGTPFSEYYRIKCLSELGHEVDLVTYPIGEDVEIPGLRIFRTPRLPGVADVPIGPSLVKIPLDTMLFYKAWRHTALGGYDLIHSHEEGGIMGHFLARYSGLPHVYDMHSSLPQQLDNFRFTHSRLIKGAFNWMERTVVEGADAVIAICPALVETVLDINPRAWVTLIENTAESHAVDEVSTEVLERLRKELKLEGKRSVLYVGTFESYQGLDLLLQAIVSVAQRRSDVALLLVGGKAEQVENLRCEAKKLGIDGICRFTGQVPHSQVPAYLKLADVLVSPRKTGTNTPLKIYSYLRAGVPIVATNLPTHTQVLNRDVAILTPPEPWPFAEAIAKLLDDTDLATRLCANAFRMSEDHYSYKQYVEKTRRLYDGLSGLVHGRRQKAL